MTPDAAFLAAIRAAPDDDAPRLIFADWLEERGDPDRAAFIRIECARAKTPRGPAYDALRDRAADLLGRHHRAWFAPLESPVDDWLFRRGCLEEVRLDVRLFAAVANELFGWHPVQKLELRAAEDFRGRWREETLHACLACPHLVHLADLGLRGCRIGDQGVEILARPSLLTSLRSLDLGDNAIGPAGARALASALNAVAVVDRPRRLQTLRLDGNPLGAAGEAALRAFMSR
jgi:uncharacterized protein (TIGR02996 family)